MANWRKLDYEQFQELKGMSNPVNPRSIALSTEDGLVSSMQFDFLLERMHGQLRYIPIRIKPSHYGSTLVIYTTEAGLKDLESAKKYRAKLDKLEAEEEEEKEECLLSQG